MMHQAGTVAAPESAGEVTPGTTSTSAPPYHFRRCSAGPALLPYIACPRCTMATIKAPGLPLFPAPSGSVQLPRHGVTYVSLPGYRCFTKSTYTV